MRPILEEMRKAIESVCGEYHVSEAPEVCDECKREFPIYFAMVESEDHARTTRIASIAGDMWNQMENLRDLWTGTDQEFDCERLIADYEALATR